MDLTQHLAFFSSTIEEIEKGNKKSELTDGTTVTLPLFWQEITTTSKKISQHCTNFCLAFRTPPHPSDSEFTSMLLPLKQSCHHLRDVLALLPACCGQHLHSTVVAAAVQLLQSVVRLLTLVQEDNKPEIENAYLQLTGQAWSECRVLQSLPRTNTLAVLAATTSQAAMVQDAFTEITEALEEGDGAGWNSFQLPPGLEGLMDGLQGDLSEEDPPGGSDRDPARWSDEDKDRLKPAVNIVKGVKLLYKRTVDALTLASRRADAEQLTAGNSALWAALDNLALTARSLPEAVDDMVLAMYPAVNYTNLHKCSSVVVSQALQTLSCLQQSGAGTEQTPQQLAFLHTALTHNAAQLDQVVAAVV